MEIASPFDVQLEDPTCLRFIDTRIKQDSDGDWRLHFNVYFRSWDVAAALPLNLGGIQLMKEGMAEKIGVLDGELTANSKGAHLYKHSWKYARMRTYQK